MLIMVFQARNRSAKTICRRTPPLSPKKKRRKKEGKRTERKETERKRREGARVRPYNFLLEPRAHHSDSIPDDERRREEERTKLD